MDRIAALNEILTENSKDAFARYGLAMEYSKQGDFDRALAEFSILLENHADYTAGYFMAAQTLVRAERIEDAKKMRPPAPPPPPPYRESACPVRDGRIAGRVRWRLSGLTPPSGPYSIRSEP